MSLISYSHSPFFALCALVMLAIWLSLEVFNSISSLGSWIFVLAALSYWNVLLDQISSSLLIIFAQVSPLQRYLPWLVYLKKFSQWNPVTHYPLNLLHFSSNSGMLLFISRFICLFSLLERKLHKDRDLVSFPAFPSIPRTVPGTQ